MTYTTVPNKAAGDAFTEQMWDTYVRDNINRGVVRPIGHLVLGSASGSVTFGSIAQDWAHILLAIHARGDTAATDTPLKIRFNNDSGNNYNESFIQGAGATASSNDGFGGTSGQIGSIPANTATANKFGVCYALLPNYTSTVSQKTIVTAGGFWRAESTGTGLVFYRQTHWKSLAAITSITLLPNAGNFVTNSCFTVYGMGAL